MKPRNMIAILFITVASLAVVALFVLASEEGPEPTPLCAEEPSVNLQAPEVFDVPGEDPVLLRAEEILGGMSLYAKICQMLIVRLEALADVQEVTESGSILDGLAKYPVGGLVLSEWNLKSREQTAALIQGAQDGSELGLFIAVDEEGGTVARVGPTIGTVKLDPMFSYRDEGEEGAYANANAIARDIAELGFNLDFAPVADVRTNPKNTVIGDRAYSDDAEAAAVLVAAAVRGFGDGGVACTLKHFPGHGDTYGDTHYGPAYCDKTLEELRETELLPFIAGIEAGAEVVMTCHVTFPEIDADTPATLSERVVTDILRGELGYDGLVCTDSLEMEAVLSYGAGGAAAMAVMAGVDILLEPEDIDETIKALLTEVPRERIDESVMRILVCKLRRGIIE